MLIQTQNMIKKNFKKIDILLLNFIYAIHFCKKKNLDKIFNYNFWIQTIYFIHKEKQ